MLPSLNKGVVRVFKPARTIAAVAAITACWFHSTARANDIYVAQSTQGSGMGTDAADAFPITWLNTPGNWNAGAGTVNPGDTVHLCGVITTGVVVQASGAAGSPITILFEPGADIISPGTVAIGINVGQHDYITVDGGVNGVIECTNNGTGLAYTNNATGVYGIGNYLTVQNLAIRNMYVRTAGGEQIEFGAGIVQWLPNTAGYRGLLVSNCVIDNAAKGVYCGYNGYGVTNVTVISNTITHINWGIVLGDTSGGSVCDGWTVVGNRISQFANWDDTAQDSYHHDGIFAQAGNASSVFHSATICGNTVGPGWGGYTTAGIYMSSDQAGPILIYNNLFLCGSDYPNDGAIYFLQNQQNLQPVCRIYNNTFAGGGGTAIDWENNQGGDNSATVLDVQNNISEFNTFCAIYGYQNVTFTADYNIGFTPNPSRAYAWSQTGSAWFDTFAVWQGIGAVHGEHFDLHGSINNPMLDSAYHLASGSPAIAAGTNLSAYFTRDMAGSPRPASGAWDSGAFQHSGVQPVMTNLHVANLHVVTNDTYGLIGWWTLDADANDLSGSGNAGTLVGKPAFAAGMITNALSFNGSGQYVDMGNNLNIWESSFTLSLWANFGSDFSGCSDPPALAGKYDKTRGYALCINTANEVYSLVNDGGGEIDCVSPVANNDGNWHFWAMVVDVNAQVETLYEDGALVTSKSISSLGFLWNYQPFQIACRGSSLFIGSIDDARFFNRALSAGEVWSQYKWPRQ